MFYNIFRALRLFSFLSVFQKKHSKHIACEECFFLWIVYNKLCALFV